MAIEVLGEEAHAGTSPMKQRKDALKAAARIVMALEEIMDDPTDTVRCTFGRFEVFPGSPNTVPGRVFFTIDFRHPEPEAFEAYAARLEAACREHAGSCEVKIGRTLDALPTVFVEDMVQTIHEHTKQTDVPLQGHDFGRQPRCPEHAPDLSNRHDLRAVQGRHQPQ